MEFPPSTETLWTTTLDAKYVANRLSYEGWRVVVIPDDVLDHADFVHALRAAHVPLDPPVVFGISWDATRDSLQAGLFDLAGVRIAFVWPDPSMMRGQSPRDYENATSLLNDLTGFAKWTGPDTRPEAVKIIIGGADGDRVPERA